MRQASRLFKNIGAKSLGSGENITNIDASLTDGKQEEIPVGNNSDFDDQSLNSVNDVDEPTLTNQDNEDASSLVLETVMENEINYSIDLVIATATRPDKQINQDYHAKIFNPHLNLLGVIVADGLGSHLYSDIGSKESVDFVKRYLEHIKDIKELNITAIFKAAKENLIQFAQRDSDINFETLDKDRSFGTTLILAFEYELEGKKVFKIAYVGNGAIWHIRGNFNRIDSLALPYNALNYLNPHSLMIEGRETLYKLISISDDYYQAEPTIIELNVDSEFGDIIMICTDGIYSYDQVKMGSRDGLVWVCDEKINDFFTKLNQFLQQNASEITQDNTQLFLEDYLKSVEIDDDSTIGIIINNKAIAFQKRLKNANHTNQ